jgi:urease accessory protein
MHKRALNTVLMLAAIGSAGPAAAHTGHDLGGLASGFVHPLMGLDHLTVMLAVGAWAALTCGRRAWLPMGCFPLFMAAGALFALSGLPLGGVEAGIAGSVLIMGLLLLGRVHLPLIASAALVALFAVLHGHAHGAEMPMAASPMAYGLGFVAATAALHLGGWRLARSLENTAGIVMLRGTGALIGLFGAWLVWAA